MGMEKMQDRQEIKRRTKFKKELGICEILGISGGFFTGEKRNRSCHRIPRRAERGQHCGYEPDTGTSSKLHLTKESIESQEVKKRE